ncbi:TFIIB-type zinc ribbon-containing protein [Actinophytocola sp.]|uniref:TFIIB-type zinc ribbon-containing protein n=1 Tax=Actinophytocola sp. TaxID=1872138 RepID=UPI002ED2A0EC
MSAQRMVGRERFEDPLTRLQELAAEVIHVVCPRCEARAVDVPRPTESRHVLWWPRRLACPSCGYSAASKPGTSMWGGPVDPFFRVPLWLRAECCGGRTLWAFNEAHLDLLEGYVAARLRERCAFPGSMSMLARLPAWLKSAKHRDEVLRAIRRLRASLGD